MTLAREDSSLGELEGGTAVGLVGESSDLGICDPTAFTDSKAYSACIAAETQLNVAKEQASAQTTTALIGGGTQVLANVLGNLFGKKQQVVYMQPPAQAGGSNTMLIVLGLAAVGGVVFLALRK